MKVFCIRKRCRTGVLCLMAAAAMFCAVNFPPFTQTAAATRQLPIYCVERDQKMVSVSFDAQ